MSAPTLSTALAVRENVVRLTFSEQVQLSGLLDEFDGTLKSHYAVVEDEATFGLDGSPARPVAPVFSTRGALLNQVDVQLDRPLTPYPSVYEILVTGLFNVAGDAMVGTQSASFFGLYRGISPPTADLVVPSRDFANPQTLEALVSLSTNTTDARQLGTLPTDSTGDLATDEGLVSYKKRVFRRLSTDKGSYAHLPNYGVTLRRHVKQLARPGLIQQLAAEAEEQIREEPETQAVSVQIVTSGSITFYRVRVRTAAGATVSADIPVNPTGDL